VCGANEDRYKVQHALLFTLIADLLELSHVQGANERISNLLINWMI